MSSKAALFSPRSSLPLNYLWVWMSVCVCVWGGCVSWLKHAPLQSSPGQGIMPALNADMSCSKCMNWTVLTRIDSQSNCQNCCVHLQDMTTFSSSFDFPLVHNKSKVWVSPQSTFSKFLPGDMIKYSDILAESPLRSEWNILSLSSLPSRFSSCLLANQG